MSTKIKYLKTVIPASFDFNKMLDLCDPSSIQMGWKPKDYHVYYLLHLISKKTYTSYANAKITQVYWDNHYTGRVHLKSDYIDPIVSNRDLYFKWLAKCNVISIDPYYLPGARSKSYKLTYPYVKDKDFVIREIKNRKFIERVKIQYEKISAIGVDLKIPFYKKLVYYVNKLSINEKAAFNILGEASLVDDFNPASLKYKLHMAAIVTFNEPKFVSRRDNGRINTKFTQLPKLYRDKVTLLGKPIYGFDLSNSQPLLFLILLKEFEQVLTGKTNKLSKLLGRAPFCLSDFASFHTSEGMSIENIMSRYSGDISKYEEWVTAGTLYQKVSQHMFAFINKKISHCNDRLAACPEDKKEKRKLERWENHKNLFKGDKARSNAKRLIFKLFYSKTLHLASDRYLMKGLLSFFKSFCPTLLFVIEFHKDRFSNGHGNLAVSMQRIESQLFIEHIGRQIFKAGIPFITLHDSIYVHEKNMRIIKEIILKTFYSLGLYGTIGVERLQDNGRITLRPDGIVVEDNYYRGVRRSRQYTIKGLQS